MANQEGVVYDLGDEWGDNRDVSLQQGWRKSEVVWGHFVILFLQQTVVQRKFILRVSVGHEVGHFKEFQLSILQTMCWVATYILFKPFTFFNPFTSKSGSPLSGYKTAVWVGIHSKVKGWESWFTQVVPICLSSELRLVFLIMYRQVCSIL